MAGKRTVYEESMRTAAEFSSRADWPNAIKAYRAALQEYPNDVSALVGLAAVYFELEQYQSTIRALQRALKLQPANQQALNKMGEVFEHLGQDNQAAKTYVYAGNVQAKAGRLDLAVKNWENAIRISPLQLQARNNLAHAYARLGNTNRAIYELVSLAAIFQEQKNLPKAEQYLRGALKLAPEDNLVRAALSALEQGASIRAVQKEISQAAPADDESSEPEISEEEAAFFSFADTEAEEDAVVDTNPREQVEQLALEELANIIFEDTVNGVELNVDKSQIDALIGQAINWQTREDTSRAIQTYKSLLEAGLKRPSVYFLLASQYMNDGQLEQAIEAYNHAKSEQAYRRGINFALGECYRKQGNANNALRHFVEVLKLIDLNQTRRENTRKLNHIYQQLVDGYVAEGDSDKTIALVDSLDHFLSSKNYEQKILEARQQLGNGDGASVSAWVEFLETPNTEAVLAAMASTAEYMKQNMLMTAVETCYRAIQQAPFYLPLHMRLAEIYLKQDAVDDSINKYLAVANVYRIRENLERVVAIYQKILRIAPMNITVRSNLVDLYVDQDNIDAALEQYQVLADAYYQLAQVEKSLRTYQKALRLVPRSSSPQMWEAKFLRYVGDIHIQRVDWHNAMRVYERLANLVPDDEETLLVLIDLYFKLEHHDKALHLLDRITALYIKQDKQDKLLEFLQDMARLRPRELVLQEKLAGLYVQLGMKARAITQYDSLGELQLESGLRDDAVRTIKRILELGPNDPSGYKRLLAKIKGSL